MLRAHTIIYKTTAFSPPQARFLYISNDKRGEQDTVFVFFVLRVQGARAGRSTCRGIPGRRGRRTLAQAQGGEGWGCAETSTQV